MNDIKFTEVVTADKAANTKANGLWGKMALFCTQEPMKSFTPDESKDYLKNREKEAREADKRWLPSNAYKSNKSLILRAKRLEVSLLRGNGETRGKTEVQDQCNEIERKDLTPYDQFMAAMNTVSKKLSKLEHGQKITAIAAISELQQRIRKELAGEQEKKAA